MPRARKPTAVHELTGALKKNPARFTDRANEPHDNRPLGDPPMHLTAPQIVAWQEIERIAPAGVLCFADRLAVEVTAILLAAFRELGLTLPDPKLRRLESMLGQLGLTPATRSKVTAVRAAPGNQFTRLGPAPGTQR